MTANEITNDLHKRTIDQHLDFLIGKAREALETARNAGSSKLDELAVAQARQQQLLENMACRDPLTNVFSTKYFEDTLPREIVRDISAGRSYSLALFDADYLKPKNDDEPDHHDAGDRYLRSIIDITKEEIEKIAGAFIARLKKGDEFAICLPGKTADEAKEVLEKIRLRVVTEVPDRAKLTIPRNRDQTTISIGITQIRRGMSARDAILQADHALYTSKKDGRNRTTIYEQNPYGLK